MHKTSKQCICSGLSQNISTFMRTQMESKLVFNNSSP